MGIRKIVLTLDDGKIAMKEFEPKDEVEIIAIIKKVEKCVWK